MSYPLFFPNNVPSVFIFSQPDKLRVSQVTIRRPFGELDLGDNTDDHKPNLGSIDGEFGPTLTFCTTPLHPRLLDAIVKVQAKKFAF
jgi:hypothetical protein